MPRKKIAAGNEFQQRQAFDDEFLSRRASRRQRAAAH